MTNITCYCIFNIKHYTLNEIVRLLSGRDNDNLFERVINIRWPLDSLQQEVAELYPAVRMAGSDEQVRTVSQELIAKGMKVLQALLIILGEPILKGDVLP